MTSIIVMLVLVAIAVVGLVASTGGADGGGVRADRATRRRLGRAKRELNDSILNRRGARR